MITQGEFLNAVTIVNAYKLQVFGKAIVLSRLLNELDIPLDTRETLIKESSLNGKYQRRIMWYLNEYTDYSTNDKEFSEYTLGDLDGLSYNKLLSISSVGKKTANDIILLLQQVGVKIIN